MRTSLNLGSVGFVQLKSIVFVFARATKSVGFGSGPTSLIGKTVVKETSLYVLTPFAPLALILSLYVSPSLKPVMT